MLVLSHRGFHQHYPENTLDAFTAAIALGVDGIETDVQVSADGVPLLFHDRVAPNQHPIAELTHAQLSDLMGYGIPTLQDALTLPVPPHFLWNIELKSPMALEASRDLLLAYAPMRSLLITSFWHGAIVSLSAESTLTTGLLIAHHPHQLAEEFQWLQAFPRLRTLVCNFNCFSPALRQQCTALDFQVLVYNPVTPADHQSLVEWQVDGVISDRPDWLLCIP